MKRSRSSSTPQPLTISGTRRLLFRIAVPLLSVLVFLCLLEITLRLVGVDTYFQNRFFVLNRALDYPEIFQKDHDLFWRLRPNRTEPSHFFEGNAYHINNLGLRGDNVQPAKTRPRLLTLGNSCTFGWGVADNQTFAVILGHLLAGQFDVINAGVPGYTSYQGRVFFEKELVSELQPDVVLVMFGWNDLWAAANGIPDKDQEFPPQVIITVQNQLSRLHSYRLLKKLLLTTIEQNPDSLWSRHAPTYRVSLEDFADNLRSICRSARQHGCGPVLMTVPIAALDLYYPPDMRSNLHRAHNAYNDVTRQVALEESVMLIDLAERFNQQPGLYDDAAKDPMHFNAAGHRFAAETIYQGLSDSTTH